MTTLTNIKDPDETLDYGLELEDWLENGDSVSAHAWTVESGMTEVLEIRDGTKCAVLVSGGSVGTVYALKGVVTTAEGRVLVRRIRVYVQER